MSETTLKLRDYQAECIQAVFDAWAEGLTRPAAVLPTGAGKTVVFSHLIREWRLSMDVDDPRMDRGPRVMVLVHRDELADQAIDKIRSIAPDLNVGKVKAADNDITADVMVCSVQTVSRAGRLASLDASQSYAGGIGLIITDECHHAAAESYQRVYEAFPEALQLGVTATMARGDRVGLGSTWEEVVYRKSILWMIGKNYLVNVKGQAIAADNLNLEKVKTSKGDYQGTDLGQALEESGALVVTAQAYRQYAADRQGLAFLPSVAAAHAQAEAFRDAGFTAAAIDGETPREERQQIYADARSGKVQILVNCGVLTEGFDMPQLSCVVPKPTQSEGLYQQMVGRVLRLYPGKSDALVLDVQGATAGHKLKTLIDLEPGSVTVVKPGQLLTDAVIEEAEAGNRKIPAGSVAFELRHRDVLMFGASEYAWHKTRAGVLFIGCGDNTVFLWPTGWPNEIQPGLWDVCLAPKGQAWRKTSHSGLDLGSAMAWGESVAEDYAGFGITRSASWRKAKASQAQINFASSLGIAGASDMRKGELSEAISVAMASRQFDQFV